MCFRRSGVFWLLIPVCLAQTLTVLQKPRMLVRHLNTPVQMSCTQTTDHDWMYWYQQKDGGQLKLIAYQIKGNDAFYEPGYSANHFTMERTEDGKTTSLDVKSVTAEDEAVYFCASSDAHCYKVAYSLSNNLTREH